MQFKSILLVRLSIFFLAFAAISAAIVPVLALDTTQAQASIKKLGGQVQFFTQWQNMLRDVSSASPEEKLKRVNEFFNRRIAFNTNLEVWGQADYWATMLETLSKQKADCKGYVVAKYFSLLELNIPVKQLRLIYVKARVGGEQSTLQLSHMVLAYYPTPESEPLVLDNLITDIRPASRRPDLLPIFSFNSDGIFVGTSGGASVGPGGVGQLSSWADLLRRVHEEGF